MGLFIVIGIFFLTTGDLETLNYEILNSAKIVLKWLPKYFLSWHYG